MTIPFTFLHPRATQASLGFIPDFINPESSTRATEQLHQAYLHGGGWRPAKGFTLNPNTLSLHYPGDPPTIPLAKATLRDETIVVYEHAWVAVIQADGSYEISRMD